MKIKTRHNLNFKKLHHGDKLALLAILVAIIAGLALYAYLPEQVASHWNLDGLPTGFMDTPLFLAGFPALMILIYIGMSLLPQAKELKYEMELLHREYASFKAAITAFLAYIYIIILYANSDFSPLNISISQLVFPGISVFLYYVATVLPRLKRNHYIGIRTPWTIHSDEVWHRTHALGGKLFKALSIAVMLATLTASTVSTWLVVVPILAVGAILLIYSYRLSAKLKGKPNASGKKTKNSKAKKKK